MEEPNILKDIYTDVYNHAVKNRRSPDDITWFEYELRQEGLKWIRKYKTMALPEKIPECVREYGTGMVVDFIFHFFDFTETDLEELDNKMESEKMDNATHWLTLEEVWARHEQKRKEMIAFDRK